MPQDHYRFIEEGEDYDVALVRSAQLGEMSFPKQLLAIARAGAGVDNIPVDRCIDFLLYTSPSAASRLKNGLPPHSRPVQ